MADRPTDNSKQTDSQDDVSVQRQVADVARDLMGRECQTQPGSKQLLVLQAGQMDLGCALKDFDKASGNNIDVLALYKEVRPSLVYFELMSKGLKLGGGTGNMVKSEANSCKILTDNHVVSDDTKQKYGIDDVKIVTEDGTRYDTKVYRTNPAKDLAVVEIQTGKDTDKICKPIGAVDLGTKLQPGDTVVTYGQPYGTGSIYTSEGTVRGETTRGRAVREIRAAPLPPGDDKDRALDVLTLRATPGYSGAGVYLMQPPGKGAAKLPPQMSGVIDMADTTATGLMTPITQQDIKALTD